MRVLVIDNYDSFTYNLVQYLGELGAELEVVRNDRASVDELLARSPDRVVVSPGPCTPDEAGISLEVVRRFPRGGNPDARASASATRRSRQAFGGEVIRHHPVHGKTGVIEHDGRTLYAGLPSPLTVGRYHSLIVADELPDCLEVSARGEGVVMGIRHRELPAEGVQFHPESVLTEDGMAMLANFLDAVSDDVPTRSSPRRSTPSPPGGTWTPTRRCGGARRDHARRGLAHPDRRLPDRAAHQGRDRRGARRARARDARARGAGARARAGPARHGGHGRRREQLQRLDDRGADRGGRGLRGRQARQPLRDEPVGLRRPARGARSAHRPRPRRRRALHRRGRLRLHVRARRTTRRRAT